MLHFPSCREFFTNESTAIAWGETYDVSAEKHASVSSNEQITLQSTRFSSMSMQTTRNDSAVMDISTVSNNATKSGAPPQEKLVNFKPTAKNGPNPIPVHEKENIEALDDMDLTLELPPPAPPTKSFSSKVVPSIFSSSLRPSFSNSTAKLAMAELSHFAEKTSGSDNMDISGIEPTDQNEVYAEASTSKRASEYLKSVNGDKNLFLKNQQNPKSQVEDIQFDKTQVNDLRSGRLEVALSTRETINQSLEMSLEGKNLTKSKDVSGSFADMSIETSLEQVNRPNTMQTTDAIDMEMSRLKPSSAYQDDFTNEPFKKPISRRTVTISHDITTDDFNASKANPCGRLDEISVQYFDPNKPYNMETSTFLKPTGKSYRQSHIRRTINEPHDITTDETNASTVNPYNRTVEMSIAYYPAWDQPKTTVHQAQDMELSSACIQQSGGRAEQNLAGNSTVEKRSSRRQTILQEHDMDLDSPLKNPNEIMTASSSRTQSRQTIHKPHDISVDFTEQRPTMPKIFASLRRQTTHTIQDISLDTSNTQSNESLRGNAKSTDGPAVQHRRTVTISNDITTDDFNAPKANSYGRPGEISVPYFDSLTIKEPHDITTDETNASTVHPYNRNVEMSIPYYPARDQSKTTVHHAQDMEMSSTYVPAVQHGNRNWKKNLPSTSRMTINEPTDMSFDSNATGKSNIHSRYDKTILGDMPMELQSTDVYGQLNNRKSVICKSPRKNGAATFDQSSLEFTKLIDQNNLSCHSLHTTKFNDRNISKFSEFELNMSDGNSSDDNLVEQKDPEPPALKLSAPTHFQTIHSVYDLDISEDSSPIPTAKKFNLNKTPYYAELDRGSDSSSLELTDNNFNDESHAETKRNEQQSMAATKQCRETKIFHQTINDQNSYLNVAEANGSGRISPASVPMERSKLINIDDLIPDNSKRLSMPNQSLFQLSSIGSPNQIDDSVSLTNSHSSAPTNLANVSIGANDSSKQLTFIEDDDDDDQICNTKIDFASSLENSENSGNDSMIASMIDIVKPIIASTSALITSGEQLDPSLCKELSAFKKSNRLRHSNVFESNEMANMNRSDTDTFNDESANAAAHNSKTTLADIGQSQIMQRRSNNTTANDEANESSFLKKRPAKKASEVKLDFSGYDEFAGLATPMDVFDDFLQRMEQIDRQNEIWAEQYRKFEAGEIDNFDDNNNQDPNSQNVEAPSWTFLYKNMMQEEL